MLDDRFLYKYRSINKSDDAKTHHIITDREAYFANRSSFNDPFDCRHRLVFDGTSKQKTKYIKRTIGLGNPKISKEAMLRRIKAIKSENLLNDPDNIAKFLSIEEEVLEDVGIFCLARVPNDILMWSHYADGHRGYCLVFNDNSDDPFISRARKVDYQDEIPIVNPVIQDTKTRFRKSLLTKSKHWEYENEWRIIDPENGPGPQIYPDHLLHGVILGANISSEDRILVRHWCRSFLPSIEFYQAHLHESQYALRIERVSDFE